MTKEMDGRDEYVAALLIFSYHVNYKGAPNT